MRLYVDHVMMHFADMVVQLILSGKRSTTLYSTAFASICFTPERRPSSRVGPVMMSGEVVHAAKCFVIALGVATLEEVSTVFLVTMDFADY
jgi:hypothetical protein